MDTKPSSMVYWKKYEIGSINREDGAISRTCLFFFRDMSILLYNNTINRRCLQNI